MFDVTGIMDGWKAGDLPGPQMINIVLKQCFSLRDGSISLTTQLATENEVDHAVDQLIRELEVVRKKAKSKIAKDTSRIRNSS